MTMRKIYLYHYYSSFVAVAFMADTFRCPPILSDQSFAGHYRRKNRRALLFLLASVWLCQPGDV